MVGWSVTGIVKPESGVAHWIETGIGDAEGENFLKKPVLKLDARLMLCGPLT